MAPWQSLSCDFNMTSTIKCGLQDPLVRLWVGKGRVLLRTLKKGGLDGSGSWSWRSVGRGCRVGFQVVPCHVPAWKMLQIEKNEMVAEGKVAIGKERTLFWGGG